MAAAQPLVAWAFVMLRVLVCLGLWSGVASAESRLRWYGEPSLWVGHLWGETTLDTGLTIDGDGTLIETRFSGGALLGGQDGVNARIGPVIDLFMSGASFGAAFGIEADVDWDLAPCWRLGLRMSGSLGTGDGTVTTGDGQVLMVGVRARTRSVVFGVDGMFVRRGEYGQQGHGNGILFGVGADGRAGKYGIVFAGGAAALVAIIGLLALSQTNFH